MHIDEQIKELYNNKHLKKKFRPGVDLIHYAGRVFDEKEIQYAVDACIEFQLTEGKYINKFERGLEKYLGVKHAITVNSGSSANLIAVSALTSDKLGNKRLKPGDEIITTAVGFPTTLAPIIQNGLVPVFVDVELGSYNINPDSLRKAIGPRTKAIFIPHTLGIPFDVQAIFSIANEFDLWIIEDNCDALGAASGIRKTGSVGHISTLSFYPAHMITTGEGGAVITSNSTLADICRSFRDWGRDCVCKAGQSNSCGLRFSGQFGQLPEGYDHKYVYSHIGYNLKMTEMQAAIGCAQLEKLPSFIQARRDNHARISALFDEYGRLFIPHETRIPTDFPAWFCYVVTLTNRAKFNRNEMVSYFEKKKIETRPVFAGNLLCHPAFKNIKYRIYGNQFNTNTVLSDSFFIGVYPGIDVEQIKWIGTVLKTFVENNV
ncbi:MAG: lipopolysaccharide biosynthesis protein RfbH [Paludibacteraceae bacterium]|nr:lipopolysaccharide biosynthesis protein RfbH [Paludibacteraceae bacterium]